jgi:UDP-glucose 4-epimerase
VQLLDAEDAIGALRRAVLEPVRGAVNVAGDGVVSHSRALRQAHRPALPIAGPLWGPLVGAARSAAGQPALPDEIARYLRFGRGVDTTRMRTELGFRPEHSTLEALARAAGIP